MKLILQFKDVTMKEFILDKEVITAGREPNNDIVIDNLAVSRYHIKIYRHANDYLVEDLSSGNGTFVNDKKIDTAVLHDKDVILLGKHTLVFANTDESLALEPGKVDTSLGEETYILSPSSEADAELRETGAAGSIDILSGGTPQATIKLTRQRTVAGKNPRAEIPVRGLFVSDVAFTIDKTAAGFVITRTAGRRTTRVNGQAVHGSQALKDGDIITIGATKLCFHQKP